MPDIDLNILNNKELGNNNHLPYLDEVQAQVDENLRARREKRAPESIPTRGAVDNTPDRETIVQQLKDDVSRAVETSKTMGKTKTINTKKEDK